MKRSKLSLFSLSAVLMLPLSLHATNFRDAANLVLQSNNSGALAMYYGLLSLQNDSRTQLYYAWINMVSARNKALTAYQKASIGYAAQATNNGLQAKNSTYYDWLYKSRAASSLYLTYLYGRRYDTSRSISNGYAALLYTGRAAYYTGLASNGGVN